MKNSEIASARRSLGEHAAEVEDMMVRLRGIDMDSAARDFPNEVMCVWQSLCALKSAVMDLHQSIRERDAERLFDVERAAL